MDIKDRISEFIKYKSITIAEFERNVGLANGYIKKFKGSIGSDKLNNVASFYPELNIDWLVTGKGPMLKSDPASSNVQTGTINTNHQGTFHDVSTSIGGYSKLEEENEKLRKEVEELRAKVTTLQNQLLAEKDRVIEILSKGR